MANSMTGYGRGEMETSDGRCVVEAKSVNHRFLEVNVKSSARVFQLDEKTRKVIKERFSRGYFEVYISLESGDMGGAVDVNEPLLQGYLNTARQLSRHYGIEYPPSFDSLVHIRDMFNVSETSWSVDECWSLVESALNAAIDQLDSGRGSEGENIHQDLKFRIGTIAKHTDDVERICASLAETRFAALKERMEKLVEDAKLDENRLAQEAGVLADRYDISEEITRLKSHLGQADQLLDSDEPIGRKLEFFVQEINREANTVGSKTTETDVTNIVVEVKSELEKIREQAQNLE